MDSTYSRRPFDRPLRAVIATPFGDRIAGSENILWSLLTHREHAGLVPHVVFLRDGSFPAEVRELGISTSVIDSGRFREPWRLALAIRRQARLLRSAEPDVCISWFVRAQTVMAPAAALTGNRRRIVCWEHEVPDPPVLLHRIAMALPCAWVVADSLAGSVANRAMWPHRDGIHVWPGIAEPARPPAGAIAALRERLALPESARVVGVVGRLIEWKGQHRLIEAIGLLRDRGVDVHVLIVGATTHGADPAYERSLHDLVDARDLRERVHFCGHVPSPWAHVLLCDAFVSASDGEPFGLVLLEAMALGVPVVAVDRYGPAEILAEGSGVLVPSPAPDDLADGIARLLADPGERKRVVERARARYYEYFTPEAMAYAVGRTLRGVAAEQPRSSAAMPRRAADPAPRA